MSVTCACGRPVEDALVCSSCAKTLAADLADVAEISAELDVMLARMSTFGDRAGGRSSSTPLPYDQRASEAAYVLRNTLTSTARLVVEERGVPEPLSVVRGPGRQGEGDRTLGPLSTPLVASWLVGHVEWLRHHEAAEELLDELASAIAQARRAIDRPADRWYAGRCGDGPADAPCGEDLYAKAGSVIVACRSCGAEYDVQERRAWLAAAVEEVLANATEIARALTSLAMPVTSATVRGYARHRRLEARGKDLAGRPLYRVGDVLDILVADKAREGKGKKAARVSSF